MAGCAQQVAQAPFPLRPDTVQQGDLRGPFSGQIVDAATGNPISGALVFASWASWAGGVAGTQGAVHAPLVAQTRSMVTRPDGGYELAAVPLLSELIDGGALLRRFTLIVYKAGYLGYRSDLRYDDRLPRHDFAQRGQIVKLERFPEGESHTRHLTFLGGGVELRRVAQAEYTQAALELSDQAAAASTASKEAKDLKEAPAPQEAPLSAPVAASLLTVARLQAVTGSKLTFASERVPEAPPTAGEQAPDDGAAFDSVHLQAQGRGEAFDAALRLWLVRTPEQAQRRFARGKAALLPGGKVKQLAGSAAKTAAGSPGAATAGKEGSPGQPLGDEAVLAFDGKRRIYGVLLVQRDLVLQLSCGASLCTKEDQAVKLMAQILAAHAGAVAR